MRIQGLLLKLYHGLHQKKPQCTTKAQNIRSTLQQKRPIKKPREGNDGMMKRYSVITGSKHGLEDS